MQVISLHHAAPCFPGRQRSQQGQALILGLFVLIGGLTALFFLFNTGQLIREKTKLTNTADAVAYSAGIMHARALNFEAYTNRAMMANTVAIAQLVSLSSWIQYANNMATYGWALENPKFVLFYPSYYAAMYSGPYLQGALVDGRALEDLATTSNDIIQNLLMTAQQMSYAGLLPARQLVMEQVAQANYNNDGTVTVDPVPLTATEFTSFVTRYSGDERTRFADAVKVAAYRDKFLPKRSWMLPGLWSDCPAATGTGRVDWLDRRGGTELLGFDEWKAMDTLSEKRWVPKNKTDVMCMAVAENPQGWGAQSAADNSQMDLDPTHYDYTMLVNPGATGMAMFMSSSSWDYSGIPNFYDLSSDALSQEDPRLKFAIRVKREIAQTVTSEGRSAINKTNRLNAFQASPAGGSELIAVSASEVFVERPDLDSSCPDGQRQGRENCYGRELSKGREIGSLFNPYWQVHLIQSDDSVRKAQALQGVVLP